MYLFANVSELGLSGVEFAKRLATEARVLIYPSLTSTSDMSYAKYVRFTFTSVTTEQLSTALERIEGFVKKL